MQPSGLGLIVGVDVDVEKNWLFEARVVVVVFSVVREASDPGAITRSSSIISKSKILFDDLRY